MKILEMLKTQRISLAIAIMILFSVSSCTDSSENMDTPGTARMQVALVDDPAEYDAILIDVQGISYKLEADTASTDDSDEEDDDEEGRITDDEDSEWVSFDITPQIFDILTLNNGEEAILADEEIPAGELKQVRVILGDNNKIVVSGDTLDLKVPSGQTSGLKIKIESDVESAAFYKLTLDFDAAKSIVEKGNGKYSLKPVIYATVTEASEDDVYGKISGVVSPDSVSSVVYLLNLDSEDTLASSMPEDDGTFLFSMLMPDTYNIIATPSEASELNGASEENVMVTAGEVTELDTLYFTE